jgi:hypothetical protein
MSGLRPAGVLAASTLAGLALAACLFLTEPESPAVVTIQPPSLAVATAIPSTAVLQTQAPSDAASPAAAESPDPAEAAVSVLAMTLGQPVDSISIIEMVPVQWSDSSLGCPEPGMAYLQVITPGYLVTLQAGDEVYAVHTDLAGTAIVCQDEIDPIGPGTARDPVEAEFIGQARSDLADRLGMPVDAVVLVYSEAVEWSSSALGCSPAEGEEPAQMPTVGYRIVLAAGESQYEYHTDQHRMILCLEPLE